MEELGSLQQFSLAVSMETFPGQDLNRKLPSRLTQIVDRIQLSLGTAATKEVTDTDGHGRRHRITWSWHSGEGRGLAWTDGVS